MYLFYTMSADYKKKTGCCTINPTQYVYLTKIAPKLADLQIRDTRSRCVSRFQSHREVDVDIRYARGGGAKQAKQNNPPNANQHVVSTHPELTLVKWLFEWANLRSLGISSRV
jgi:hypothetical protein